MSVPIDPMHKTAHVQKCLLTNGVSLVNQYECARTHAQRTYGVSGMPYSPTVALIVHVTTFARGLCSYKMASF